jgi:hypothetical protein
LEILKTSSGSSPRTELFNNITFSLSHSHVTVPLNNEYWNLHKCFLHFAMTRVRWNSIMLFGSRGLGALTKFCRRVEMASSNPSCTDIISIDIWINVAGLLRPWVCWPVCSSAAAAGLSWLLQPNNHSTSSSSSSQLALKNPFKPKEQCHRIFNLCFVPSIWPTFLKYSELVFS